MKSKYILLVMLLAFYGIINGQVKNVFSSKAQVGIDGYYNHNYQAQIFSVPVPDMNKINAEEKADAASPDVKPFRFAEPVAVNLDIAKLASWVIDKTFAYGRFSIHAANAQSLSINFSPFYLPEGAEMFIYNKDGRMITGPITPKENNELKLWGSTVYKGDILTIEIKIPTQYKKALQLHITNVAYGYKPVFCDEKNFCYGQSGTCEINVVCPLGNGWDAEKNSVCLILNQSGSCWCSGAMVGNTCNYDLPYLLTANHCLNGGAENVANWRFNFQWWSPTCASQDDVTFLTFNGSVLKANNVASDFALLQLNQKPAANSGINYAGWSRSAVPAAQGVGIHHPAGDVMKISKGNNPVVRTGWGGAGNDHWQVTWSPQNNGLGQVVTAVTEGGSSGSPLFDQNHRIVGQLHGGPSACGGTQPWDYYGSFDVSWTGGGTNNTRLSNWLDPGNSGAVTTNTINISNLYVTPVANAYLTMTGSSVVCGSTQTYSITGVLPTATVTWQLSAPVVGSYSCQLPLQNVCTLSANGSQATLTKVSNGNVHLQATITNCGGIVEYAGKDITFGTPSATNNGGYTTYNGPCKPIVGTVNMTNGSTTWVSMAFPGNNQYTITKTSGSSNATWNNTGSGTFNFTFTNPNGSSNIGFNITTINSCGTHSDPVVFYYNGPAPFSVVPNPANNTVNISVYNTKLSNEVTTIKQIKVVDELGNIKLYKNYGEGTKSTRLDVSNLGNNVYYLHIFNGKTWVIQKLTIVH